MMIEFRQATKLYRTVIGVNDVTLSLEPGAYGLLGPNGSGKTTMINLMTGQLRPTIGHVSVFGEDPWKCDRVLRRIGVCPASDLLLPNISARDWVCYLVQLHGFKFDEAKRRTEEAMELVGMSHAMNRPIGSYSLGMRQRTKLAQSLAHDPELLILDEPFNGLDPVARHQMTQLLLDWIRRGKSLILASHILHEVEAVRPAFLLLSGGRLLASGSLEEVNSLLADLPNEIWIRLDKPQQVARLALAEASIQSVCFDDDDTGLTITTNHPLGVYERLPSWIDTCNATVYEVRSGDRSLQQLFSTLLKMHRGES